MQQNVYQKALTIFGKKAQVFQAIEEMSELIKEIIKNENRGEANFNQVIEEIADVEIMLTQLKMIYEPKAQISVEWAKKNKLDRLKDYLGMKDLDKPSLDA